MKHVRGRTPCGETDLERVLVAHGAGQFEQQVPFISGTVRPSSAGRRSQRRANGRGLGQSRVLCGPTYEVFQHYAPAPTGSLLAASASAVTTCASSTTEPMS